ncbi:hypothetical protein AWB68_03046 [Caballeronia choica]|uniref:Uncharacterized protein n=1 Tax=Caballeronia choica TaxID=326476 RepID=A0A158IU74_9BURK|nr:hypothetical protein AWB68_03046 [Caballeronia choica]
MNAPHWIAGAWGGMPSVDSIDPATGEPVKPAAQTTLLTAAMLRCLASRPRCRRAR